MRLLMFTFLFLTFANTSLAEPTVKVETKRKTINPLTAIPLAESWQAPKAWKACSKKGYFGDPILKSCEDDGCWAYNLGNGYWLGTCTCTHVCQAGEEHKRLYFEVKATAVNVDEDQATEESKAAAMAKADATCMENLAVKAKERFGFGETTEVDDGYQVKYRALVECY